MVCGPSHSGSEPFGNAFAYATPFNVVVGGGYLGKYLRGRLGHAQAKSDASAARYLDDCQSRFASSEISSAWLALRSMLNSCAISTGSESWISARRTTKEVFS